MKKKPRISISCKVSCTVCIHQTKKQGNQKAKGFAGMDGGGGFGSSYVVSVVECTLSQIRNPARVILLFLIEGPALLLYCLQQCIYYLVSYVLTGCTWYDLARTRYLVLVRYKH